MTKLIPWMVKDAPLNCYDCLALPDANMSNPRLSADAFVASWPRNSWASRHQDLWGETPGRPSIRRHHLLVLNPPGVITFPSSRSKVDIILDVWYCTKMRLALLTIPDESASCPRLWNANTTPFSMSRSSLPATNTLSITWKSFTAHLQLHNKRTRFLCFFKFNFQNARLKASFSFRKQLFFLKFLLRDNMFVKNA